MSWNSCARLPRYRNELISVPTEQRRPWDAAAAAKYVFDLALSLENLCKRRYLALGLPHPTGPDSHSRVLDDFLAEPNLGGELTGEESLRLKKYVRFRHRFAHGYGHEIDWPIVEEPLRLLPETVERLTEIWERWLETV